MRELTVEDITTINQECPYNQGLFREPYGIPLSEKELVVYCRYETGRTNGGSCYDNSDPQPYRSSPPKNRMKVLELVLAILKPTITFLQYKTLESLIKNNSTTEWEYYGNSTDWEIEYIPLVDLYEALANMEA